MPVARISKRVFKREQGKGVPSLFPRGNVEPQGKESALPDSSSDECSSKGSSLSVGINEYEDETEETQSKPYSALLQTLNSQDGHHKPRQGHNRHKRRKIDLENEITIVQDDNQIDHAEEDDESGHPDNMSEMDAVSEGSEDDQDVLNPFGKHFVARDASVIDHLVDDVNHDKWRSAKLKTYSLGTSLSKVPTSAGADPMYQHGVEFALKSLKSKLKEAATLSFSDIDPSVEAVVSPMFNYQDVLYPLRSFGNAEKLRRLASLHLLDHILKTRERVIKNNAKLSKVGDPNELELRDQGFTRPKILLILPTRQSCVRYLDTLVEVYQPEQQENKKRFLDTYSSRTDNVGDTKPQDFRELFAGNDDDMFRLGVKLTRKTIKYFAKFYNSDIIIASPLGLRLALGGGEGSRKQDYDFLSSIEVLILDQIDALSMQNWEHIDYAFEHLNLQPKEAHGSDFSRVRHWYLDGRAKYFRQTILFSAFNFPALNSLFTRHMHNITGKTKYTRDEQGMMLSIGVALPQSFQRFVSAEPINEPEDRFRQFLTTFLPSMLKLVKIAANSAPGILIFVPTYADFVRLRNHLAAANECQELSYGLISEYTSVKEVARARSHFLTGKHAALLYTERAHHFRRYKLKGVKQIFMYGLPENPLFYQELVGGCLNDTITLGHVNLRETFVKSLFCKWDVFKLERIVGSTRARSMLQVKTGDVFDFL